MATLAYTQLDDYDRGVFDHLLSDDIERYAFIRFFEHVATNYPRNKRPRTGHSRVRLWNKSSRYWIHKAQAQQPLPAIERSAPGGGVAAAPAAPVVIPEAPSAPTLNLQMPSVSIDITPIPGPMQTPTLNATRSSATAEIKQSAVTNPESHSTSPVPSSQITTPVVGTKRTREHDDDPSVASLEPPAKRRLPVIGGERCPPFVLHNGLYEIKPKVPKFFPLPPTLQQREFVQKTLGGVWRYAKTLHQQSISSATPKPRSGVAPRSTDLFVKVDEQGLIEDRVVAKCTDVSWDKDRFSKERVKFEEAVINTIPHGCLHLPSYRGVDEHSMTFTIDGGYSDNKDPSTWKQKYVFSEYAPHGNLHELIENHNCAKKPIPEHFIWYVFKQLVEALTTLATGHCSDTHDGPITSKKDGWHRILHLDVKGPNVLLGTPDSKYTSYRQPVLTDFDTSVRLSSDPKTRSKQIEHARGCGTRYYQAPELTSLHRQDKHYKPKDWPLDSWTDIYSLGLLIRHMMMCSIKTTEEMTQLQKEEAAMFPAEAISRDSDPEYELHWKNYPDIYSTALIRTVQRCLAFRPFHDRAKPRKAWRPSLNELQKRINDNLARLDAICGDGVNAAQHHSDHPLHVLFPKEDPQFTIGARFTYSEPTASVKNLGLSSVTEEEKGIARTSWAAHVARFSEDSDMDMDMDMDMEVDMDMSVATMENVLNELVPRCREKLSSIAGLSPPEREANFHALQHATTTIGKCVNANGTFTQLRAKIPPNFLTPKMKRDTLLLLQHTAQELSKSINTSLSDRAASAAVRDEELAVALQALRRVAGTEDFGQIIVARKKVMFLEDREKLKQKEEASDREMMDALKQLVEAVGMGVDLLVLGEELELELDAERADEHWMTQISAFHRGVWEYFWNWPSGVFNYT